MPKLTYTCPECNKQLKLKEEMTLDNGTTLYFYMCGHFFHRSMEQIDPTTLDFTAKDLSGKRARHYQEAGVQFILEHDFNVIIGDQMRLGKTPQALVALSNRYKERTPCLIIVRPANLWQWTREYKVWTDTLPNGIFPIIGTKAWIPPGFSAYIISMDTFSRPKIIEELKKINFKLIIVDEAHSFKNTDSNRSQALVDFVAYMNTGESPTRLDFTCARCGETWFEAGKQKFDKRIGFKTVSKSSRCPACHQYCYQSQAHSEKEDAPETKPCGMILLTGTPILNRAEEYFVPLNLVNPEKFSSLQQFRNMWLEQDASGKWNRVKRSKLEAFKQEVAKYLLRREKEDVYTDLPAINRIFTVMEPEKSAVTEYYNKILDKMEEEYAKKANPSFWDMNEHLMALKRATGMMKVPWAVNFCEMTALESAKKMAIGIHHESVRDTLYLQLGADMNCYKLSGEDNADRKDWIMRNWETSNKQFLIINMLAGGVGMDFHYCDNVLIMERQWNSEVEAQFEFRFYNPDSSIKKNSTTVEYVVAKGTLDEWLCDLIDQKKQVVGETVYNNWNIESDREFFKALIERTIAGRLK